MARGAGNNWHCIKYDNANKCSVIINQQPVASSSNILVDKRLLDQTKMDATYKQIGNIISPIMKADTGASNHFTKPDHESFLKNLSKLKGGPVAYLPDTTRITASKAGQLSLSRRLSDKSQRALVYPELKNESLLSIGQLCDDNCTAIFKRKHMKIYKDEDIQINELASPLILGKRNNFDGLWDVPFHIPDLQRTLTGRSNKQQINYIIRRDKDKLELAKYLHACAYSPTISTFEKAIKNGNFITWPGIETLNFQKLLGTTLATELGHLDQERKNLQSTKVKENDKDDLQPKQSKNKTYECFCTIERSRTKHRNLKRRGAKHKTYSDQTGKFPYQSSRGNQYIFILYDYDGNAILSKAIKSRSAKHIKEAWEYCNAIVTKHGNEVKLHVLDNEASATLKEALRKNNITYQLAPPNQHRINAAERAIRTYKNHLLAGIATCDPDFPIREWDRLLEQCDLTLNLLRNARANPNLSAWAYLHGVHDFNRSPLLPPGTKVLIHEKPSKRKSWAFHGEKGWYVAPAKEHYRCLKCYVPKTRQVRITDTATIIPKQVPIPQANTDDYIRTIAGDLVRILLQRKGTINLPEIRPSSKEALIKISEILHRSEKPQTLHSPTCEGAQHKSKGVQWTSEGAKCTLTKEKLTTPKNWIPDKIKSVEPKGPRDPLTTMIKENMNKLKQAIQKHEYILRKHETSKDKKVHDPKLPVDKGSKTTATKETHNILKPSRAQSAHPMKLRRQHPQYTKGYHQAAKALFLNVFHIFDAKGKKLHIDALLKTNPTTWGPSVSNELGRLAQGIRNVKGNDVIEFIQKSEVPKNKKVAYANMVCDFRPMKLDKWRTRLTIGGDILDYEGDSASPAATLLETKLILNSTISESHQGARFMTIDLKDHFLQTIMKDAEYMRIHNKYFFEDMRKKYHINNIVDKDGFVYCRIKRGMYGLKQAARLAHDQLVNHLHKYGYSPDKYAPNIWGHETRKTKFCLCVDDFGVKYFSKNDANHLITALQHSYDITTDWEGKHYCGLALEWDYEKGHVDISMPEYVVQALQRLQHMFPRRPQYSPHRWEVPNYSSKVQYAKKPDMSELLGKDAKTRIQRVVGTFLYYGRAIDNTTLTALNDIAQHQASPTVNTNESINMFLDYMATNPDAKIRFRRSDMILHADTDAAYLVASGARSRIAGYFYMGNKYHPSTIKNPENNGPVHIECHLLRHVVSSAAEAETAGLFFNCKTVIVIRQMLIALGHAQPPTPIRTDNSTAVSFANMTYTPKRSKSWDMRFYWIKDQVKDRVVYVYWDRGSRNRADYQSKHFPPSYHLKIRPDYILKGFNVSTLIQKVRHIINKTPVYARVC